MIKYYSDTCSFLLTHTRTYRCGTTKQNMKSFRSEAQMIAIKAILVILIACKDKVVLEKNFPVEK